MIILRSSYYSIYSELGMSNHSRNDLPEPRNDVIDLVRLTVKSKDYTKLRHS